MNRYQITLVILAIALFLAGFLAGRMVTVRQQAAENEVQIALPAPVLAEDEAMPTRDVTGADVDGLPRYPGAVRVGYRQVAVGDLLETEVEYVVAGELDEVHDFYRQVFDEEEWIVADLGIYQGEWTFFVVSGEREAVVELEVRLSLVEIEIELSEPVER